MVRRGIVVAATAWLAVVLVGSTMVWAVISRAGDNVVTGVQPGALSSASGRAEPRTSKSPKVRPSHKPPNTNRPGKGSSGTSDPTGPSGPTTTAGSTGAPPPPKSTSPSPQPVKAKQATWSGVPGTVTAECRASDLTLVGSYAAPGFSVHAEKEGDRLTVEFQGQGDEQREYTVRATCVSGAPRFSVEQHGDSGGGDGESQGE